MTELPSGAVTFLFSDIEGSTRLLKTLRDLYPQVLADHRELFRAAIARQAGHEVNTEGDAFFVAFASAKRAVLCALEVQQALAAHEWPEGGERRLKDLDRPVRLFELNAPGLGRPVAPAADVPRAVPGTVRGLAPALTTFVGRAGAVEEVCGLLESRRLVTVTGPGGSTRTSRWTPSRRPWWPGW